MVKIVQDLVSESKYNTQCPYHMVPEYITIHNTANDASAENEIAYMKRNNYNSYHFAVDDVEARQGLPLDRNNFSCGDGANGTGNRKSIAIEICYSKSGGSKYVQAEENCVQLVASLLKKYGLGVDKVKKHQDWSGKYCPHRILDEGRWNSFKERISKAMNNDTSNTQTTPQTPLNQEKEIDYTGVITYQVFTNKWLPEVNKCDDTSDGYAGIGKAPITGIRAKAQYGEIYIKSRTKNRDWLEEVSSVNYSNGGTNSYSGILGTPIDLVKIRSTKGHVDYRVKTIEDGWLEWVDSRTKTGYNSYAGVHGHTIIGIQMK